MAELAGGPGLRIEPGDLDSPDVVAMLHGHVSELRGMAPPGSSHTFDVEALKKPELSFWVLRIDGVLAGCGALLELDPRHGEIKSMRTAAGFKRRGVARALLMHLVELATQRGYTRLSLDTGSDEYFRPARELYRSAGFEECGPFAGYREDPYKVFMTLEL
jgi:putative acetyltransferase